jgi:hypothetical protein
MRGHDKLIELRSRGLRPEVVFLNDYKTRPEFFDGTNIEIEGEEMSLIDLRFLVGLSVAASSSCEIRARQILEACKKSGARMVAICHIPESPQNRKTTDYMEIWNAVA